MSTLRQFPAPSNPAPSGRGPRRLRCGPSIRGMIFPQLYRPCPLPKFEAARFIAKQSKRLQKTGTHQDENIPDISRTF